jgi:hypothetical protein
METPGTKDAAESVLRELPSVVGAFVREDAYGNPREIHLLIKAGPKPASFARDVRDLLEERLAVPVDQRIISIAQLAGESVGRSGVQPSTTPAADGDGLPSDASSTPSAEAASADLRPSGAPRPEPAYDPPPEPEAESAVRLRLKGAAHELIEGRVIARVTLEWEGQSYEGEAVELEAGSGRVRAGATAALRAVTAACDGRARFELEAASVVRALGREYVVVSALASAAALGRQPLMLSGARPVDEVEPVETAAVLAVLKSANRVIGLIVRLGEGAEQPRARRGRDPRPH